MKMNYALWIAASAIIMLTPPWLTVAFVNGDGAMILCFMLFYIINPMYSVIIGIYSGKDIKRLWSLPIISAALFLIGTWIFFDMGEPAFILYMLIYIIIGVIAMLISAFIYKKKCSNNYT